MPNWASGTAASAEVGMHAFVLLWARVLIQSNPERLNTRGILSEQPSCVARLGRCELVACPRSEGSHQPKILHSKSTAAQILGPKNNQDDAKFRRRRKRGGGPQFKRSLLEWRVRGPRKYTWMGSLPAGRCSIPSLGSNALQQNSPEEKSIFLLAGLQTT